MSRARRVVVVASILAACGLGGACGATQRRGAKANEVVELRRQLDAMRRQSERDQQALRALESRLFACEDKLTVAEDAGGQPRLPVVHKRRPGGAPDRSAGRAGGEGHEPPFDDEEPVIDDRPIKIDHGFDDDGEIEIVYEGEAAKDTRPRKVVRIEGGPARTDDPFAGPDAEIDPATVKERLPVVPLPDDRPAAPDPIASYRAAYALLEKGEHAGAIAAFAKFVDTWPAHDYADNAQYWLAEAHYDQGAYKVALAEFRKVVKRWPTANKAPDAMLKIGFCHQKLADLDAAAEALSQLIATYPKTDAARLAAKRLEEMPR